MNRTLFYLSAAVGVAGMLFFAGVAHTQPGAPPVGASPAGAPAAPAPTRPTIAVFNMAAVMRDFGQAKYQVHLLNKRKIELSSNLMRMRARYIEINKELQNPQNPNKDTLMAEQLKLARDAEDEDRKINKELNDSASLIIGDLYDKIKLVVDKTAEMNGYHIVFAYPDAVTDEERKNAYIKELKLKPPAAQPFYVAPHADITTVMVKTLNAWYPPVDPVTKQPIDLSKLDLPKDATLPGGTPQPPVTGLPGGK